MSELQAPSTARLFIAIDVSDEWRRELAQVQRDQERVSPGYFRWVRSDLMHLTLHFLGNQPTGSVGAIAEALARAAARGRPFAMTLGRVGTFGPPPAPRVLWAEALDTSGHLGRLHVVASRELQTLGLSFEARPLRPHVTLGRARSARAGAFRASARIPRAEPFVAERVVLLESRLLRSGPEYVALAAPALGSSST